jgi:hypothetical protein
MDFNGLSIAEFKMLWKEEGFCFVLIQLSHLPNLVRGNKTRRTITGLAAVALQKCLFFRL